MTSRVGKIFILLLLIPIFLGAQPRVRLKAVDETGIELMQVAKGQPWFLELIIEGSRSTSYAPTIAGLDGFEVFKQGLQMNMINGIATIKQTYRVTIPRAGLYTIGPAEIKEQDQPIRSRSLTIRVGDQQLHDPRAATMHKKSSVAKKTILQISTDKERAFVGETLHFFVRFLYRTKDIALQSIQVPDFTGFHLGQKIGPKNGRQTIDSVDYEYLEWQWDLIPKEVGKLRVPVFGAEYAQQPEDDFFSGFARIMRGFNDKKRIVSNDLFITVDQLPAHEPSTTIVGEYYSLRARIDNPVVREGEGAIYSLELEGTGNLPLIENLPITGVPEAFKAYPSKAYMPDSAQGKKGTKKRFEHILQAVNRGTWEIPAQTITYFDPTTRTYKKLHSEPMSVNVIANSAFKPTSTEQALKEKKIDPGSSSTAMLEQVIEEPDTIAPLCVDYSYYQPATYRIPWWLFVLFALIPLIALAYRRARDISSTLLRRYGSTWYDRRNWKQIRHALAQAEKAGDVRALHDQFIQIFATQFDVPSAHITEQKMQELLKSKGFSEKECTAWQEFFTLLCARVFARHASVASDHNMIFKQARQWIDRFELQL